MKDTSAESKNVSRRDLLRKVKGSAKFAIPTIVSYELSTMKANASEPPGVPKW